MPKSKTPALFAERIQHLQALVGRLENTEVPLEQSLKDFEEGIRLVRSAQEELAAAEQTVHELLEDSPDEQAGQDDLP